MVDGEWTGTMNLTEPQAGSDLAAVRTRAEPQPDGTLPALRHQDLHHLRRARPAPRTSSTWCWRAYAGRARGREGHLAVRRARSSWSTPTARWARATTCTACRIEHKLGIQASPTARAGSTATTAARSATWSARRTAASSTCSS
ncbi:MAG: hypothetical protein MZW92_47660 [Comamonadaceae bacterium]|nr:hypothetical protein [Comamonadaceae bacterium]